MRIGKKGAEMMRDRLIELLEKHVLLKYFLGRMQAEKLADYLLDNGVIVTPCVAMVEQVLKDGGIDRPKTLHYAGKYSVVYIDKSKKMNAYTEN